MDKGFHINGKMMIITRSWKLVGNVSWSERRNLQINRRETRGENNLVFSNCSGGKIDMKQGLILLYSASSGFDYDRNKNNIKDRIKIMSTPNYNMQFTVSINPIFVS